MTQDEEYQLLVKEYDRYNGLHAQNLINQDNVLMQLSVGLLAVLATLGKPLLATNKILGYIVVILFAVTILQVVAGYYISNRFFVFAKAKLNSNYQNGVHPITDGLNKSIWGKLNDILNVAQFVTFLLGILAFVVLLVIFIGRK
jgi:hypothetical protein